MAVQEIHSAGEATFILQPNRSLRSGQICLAIATIGAALLGVTLYFALQGAWMVIPFTGLEMIVLVTAVYLQNNWSKQCQVLEIGENTVRTSKGVHSEESVSFSRGWLKIALVDAPSSWHPKKLIVGSHGRYVEIGAFLEESERERLYSMLRSAVQ